MTPRSSQPDTAFKVKHEVIYTKLNLTSHECLTLKPMSDCHDIGVIDRASSVQYACRISFHTINGKY